VPFQHPPNHPVIRIAVADIQYAASCFSRPRCSWPLSRPGATD